MRALDRYRITVQALCDEPGTAGHDLHKPVRVGGGPAVAASFVADRALLVAVAIDVVPGGVAAAGT